MERYTTEFYEPIVHDYANFGTWTDRGARDASVRATDVWEAILAEPELSMTPPDRMAELDAFIESARKRVAPLRSADGRDRGPCQRQGHARRTG
jgi:trimethylamine:corrinoid methyltransferase-like protein